MHRAARRGLAMLLLLVAALFAGAAAAAPRIGVATMQPGEIFWERFGHDAIVVVDPDTGAATSYNFGYFDLTEPGFVGNFVRGRMRYRLVALPLEEDLVLYRDEGRGTRIQWLDLTEAQATALARDLEVNARPENAVYTYDYFRDNCATRVRDAVDRALGGALKRALVARSQGSTYRSEAVRLASPAPWMWLGFDIGLGPAADVPLSRWDEAFVPMRLAAALREIRIDGRPLVREETDVLPHRIAPEPAEHARPVWPWLAAGLAIAALLVAGRRRAPRSVAAFAVAFWLVAGLLGALMLFIWAGTTHRFGWANHNLFLLNPIAWLLLPGGIALLRGGTPGPVFRASLAAVAAIALVGVFVSWFPGAVQDNTRWIALLVPVHLALLVALRRRTAAAGAVPGGANGGHASDAAIARSSVRS
ncbi:DUF4105 domain-containing protein [Lysobacter humi (ex Lee et al. 2017)]